MNPLSTSSISIAPLLIELGVVLFVALLYLMFMRVGSGPVILTMPVQPEFFGSPEAERIVRRYRMTDLFLALAAAALAWFSWTRQFNLGFALAPLLQIAGLLILWIATWRALLPHRAPQHVVRSASLTSATGPTHVWFATTLAAIIPLALTTAYVATQWNNIPTRFPMHWGLDGQPNGWGTRTPSDVFFAGGMGIGLVLVFTLLGWLTALYSPSSSSKPRILSFTLDALCGASWLTALANSVVLTLPLQSSHKDAMTYSLMGLLLLLMIFFVWIGRRAWQTFRAAPADQTTAVLYWVGGIFYYNPNDAALLVPKRSGMGYTFNFARPAAWGLIVLILALAMLPLLWRLAAHHG